MFPRPSRRFSKAVLSLAGAALLMVPGAPAAAQVECLEEASPYLFILFDTSGSMNRTPPCSQAEINAGFCSSLCTGAECRAPLQGDDPDSRLFQMKAALHEALASPEAENVHFGFATFNHDALYAPAKHWLYEATTPGVSLPGNLGAFPAVGSRDVMGKTWTCDEGSGDSEVGCLGSNPADLTDPWEVARVRMLSKGGESPSTMVTFFLRSGATVLRIRYTPVAGGILGQPMTFQVRKDRCLNVNCTSVDSTQIVSVDYAPVSEYLVWENGVSRTEPVGYFGPNAADLTFNSVSACNGWEPNTDSTADRFSNYSLLWPTATGDPRGIHFDQGDVIPLDWLADHREDIQEHLAPNLILNPLAAPDFRLSPYLQDRRVGSETFLRLKNEAARPLLAIGSTPQGGAIRSFRTWYAGCPSGICSPGLGWRGVAAAQDPDFFCRRQNLVVITDAEESCNVDPCATVSSLYSYYGLRTYVVAVGETQVSSKANCMADNGGTSMPYRVHLRSELVQALKDIFVAAGQP